MKKCHIDNLLIVSHVVHYKWRNAFHAYGPYAREIDIWADLFPQVQITAPLRLDKPPADCLAFTRPNIKILPQPKRGGDTLGAKILQILSLPWMIYKLSVAMRQADAIQVRCPGNLGLLGVLLAPLFSKYRVAKYAGQWNGYEREAGSYRLQRRILRSTWWNAPVLVYGKWPRQPKHIVPFFTSILEDQHLELAQKNAQNKKQHQPLRILFVGRLTRSKNVHVLLDALRIIRGKGFAHESRIIGDGPELPALQRQTADLQLSNAVTFMGGLAFEEVLAQYEWADMLVLASETEGWPKAIAEAMAFGLICIGSNRGLVPQMLAEGRGLLVEPGDEAGLASALQEIAVGKVNFSSMSRKASEWAQRYSLGGLRQAIRDLLIREWCLTDADLRTLP